ncbi:MAG: DUF3786 domain-containing protein [Anaerolineae bacterium]|nr:DUF3786 domain-containing protein [Anaerolineae bacterium]
MHTVEAEGVRQRDPYQAALDKARRELQRLDPYVAAVRSGGRTLNRSSGQAVELTYWGHGIEVTWETGDVCSPAGAPLSPTARLIVLHYLLTADGTPLADRWLSFRELPDGRVYDTAFRRRACQPLARVFGQRPAAFAEAARRLGGETLCFGDASFLFRVLPRVRVAAILYAADDEFPAEANLLFDASTRHYLPIEDVAVLGGLVAGELVRASRQTH